jgi:Glycoside hydrolase family 44
VAKFGWRRGAYLAQVVLLSVLVVAYGWRSQSKHAGPSAAGGTTAVAGTGATVSTTPSLALDDVPSTDATASTLASPAAVGVRSAVATGSSAPPTVAPGQMRRVVAYDGKLGPGWTDLGWSSSRVTTGGPAKIDMGNMMGWIVARRGQPLNATVIEFRYRTPKPLGAILQVTLASAFVEQTAEIEIANLEPDSDGWYSASVPVSSLNPKDIPYDRIRIRPTRMMLSPLTIEIDKLVFLEPKSALPADTVVAAPSAAIGKVQHMSIDCSDEKHKINPLIYGIGYAGASNQKDTPWTLGATINRWGGNPTSRYNWQIPNAWNTANDYYFRNVAITDTPNASETFLQNNQDNGLGSAVTLPMLGWVAKDTTSYSFPVSKYGRQKGSDPDIPDIGDGRALDGRVLEPGSPKATSVESTPASIGRWVTTLKGRVTMYFLDNEPELWDSTHRDVHPQPLTYDELLDKTLRYAAAVRKADPAAVIAGPSSWGWPAYFFSATDAKAGFDRSPDRHAHGNMPLIPWYLQQVRAAEKKSGVKLLDVLDVHFYPAAERVYEGGQGATDPATSALRIRQVRGLWDPTYKDESWVKQPIYLIPRLRAWIDQYAPGLGLSIGEWNFGGENHMSGALATAEALGRFGMYDVTSAFYWTNPPTNSSSYWAFRAYRNFDGAGSQFLDRSLATTMAKDVSLFASTNEAHSEMTAILLNTNATKSLIPKIALKGCGNVTTAETYTYTGAPTGFGQVVNQAVRANSLNLTLRPYSLTVVRVRNS